MPLLTLEYTSNLKGLFKPRDFLLKAHPLIADKINTKVESCKARSICHDDYFVANGSDRNAFIILTIEILSGRKPEVKKDLANELCAKLMHMIKKFNHYFDVNINVHVKELSAAYASHLDEFNQMQSI